MGVQTQNKEKNLHFCLFFYVWDTKTQKQANTFCLAKTLFYLERQGWRVELQQLPNCQNTQNPRGVQLRVYFEIGPLGGAADINQSIPSSPLQHRAGQLMLLPPEWAPCQTRQWQTEADKREALQYRKSAVDARRAQNTH